nr:hypothetical protein [Tanacetum cinerariifolium]
MFSHGWGKEKEMYTHVSASKKLKKNGTLLTVQAASRTLESKSCTTQKMIAVRGTLEVQKAQVPKRTRMPINVKMYDGTRDPDDHLKIFQAAEKIKRELLAAKEIHKRSCRNPPHQAEGRRVNGSFHEKIQGGKYACQRSTRMHEDIDIHAWNHQSESNQKLNDNIPKSMDEMMSVTTVFLRREVAAVNQSKKKAPPTWKHHESGHRPNFDKRLNFKNQHKSSRRQDRFIPLTKTPKEILTMDTVKFKAPPPMTGPTENHKKNKLCEFHEDKGDDFGQETLIVIEAEVEGYLIHHMYVDGGSASK